MFRDLPLVSKQTSGLNPLQVTRPIPDLPGSGVLLFVGCSVGV